MCQPSHDASEESRGSSRPIVVVGCPMGIKRVCVRRRVNFFRAIRASRTFRAAWGAPRCSENTGECVLTRVCPPMWSPGVSKERDAFACSRLCWNSAPERRFWLDILTTPVTRIRRFFLFGFFRDCVCMVRDAFFSRRSERNQPYSLPTLRDFRVETRVQHRLVEMLCRFSRTLARA